MSFIYQVDHEVIVRGTTTISSDVPLTLDEIEAMFNEMQPSPQEFEINTMYDTYPLHYSGPFTVTHEEELIELTD